MKIKIKKLEFKKLYDLACQDWKPKLDEKLKEFIFDENIEFEESFVKSMKQACTEDQLKVFKTIFKDYLKKEFDIFEYDTYSKVCKALKEKEQTIPYLRIKQIEKLFNRGWKPNWKDTNEYKYYPYFTVGSGGGLVCNFCYCRFNVYSGEVAFYKDKETAIFVGKTFINEYKSFRDYSC